MLDKNSKYLAVLLKVGLKGAWNKNIPHLFVSLFCARIFPRNNFEKKEKKKKKKILKLPIFLAFHHQERVKRGAPDIEARSWGWLWAKNRFNSKNKHENERDIYMVTAVKVELTEAVSLRPFWKSHKCISYVEG